MVIESKEWEPLRKKIGKKHNWLEGINSFFFELIIKDETERKIDRFVWNNKKRYKEILELLRLKYGMEYK